MFDFNFNWDNNINTNIEIVDTQHKELFRIGRAIEQLLITQCIGVEDRHLLDIVCGLRDYVAYHFYEEEQLMEQYGYSNKEEHKKMHENYRNMILNIDCKLLGLKPYEQLKLLKEDLQNMVFEHILTEDKRMTEEIMPKFLQDNTQ